MTQTYQLLTTLEGHEERVWSCSWSPNGQILASCGSDKSIRLWKSENNRWSCFEVLVEGHKRSIRSVSWSPCGQMLASSSFDGTTCVWRKEDGKMESIATLEGHENEVKSVAWASSGFMLATCGRDKSVWIWEVEEGLDDFSCITILNVHSQDVKKVKWHPNEEILVSCSYDNTLRLYHDEGDDWTCFDTLESHISTVWSFDFNESGDKIVSCSDDKTIKIWEKIKQDENKMKKANKWTCICTNSDQHTQPIYDISWCKLTGLIATACGDNCIRIFREEKIAGSEESSLNLLLVIKDAHSSDVNCVVWNGVVRGLLASCSDSSDVKLWTINY